MFRPITRRRVDNIIKSKGITPKRFEVVYAGRGAVVRHESLDHINWAKVEKLTIFTEPRLVYKGYYEGGGNYENEGPILKLENKVVVK